MLVIVPSNIYLKLENLQPSTSFKSRGIGFFILDHVQNSHSQLYSSNTSKQYFYTSSSGNAGLGCVHASVTLGCAATVVVPLSTSDSVVGKLKEAGAQGVIRYGNSWVDADTRLRDMLVKRKEKGGNVVYVPPFDDAGVWRGHAAIVSEIVEQLEERRGCYSTRKNKVNEGDMCSDGIICSIGGGGLFSGIMQGLSNHSLLDTTKIIAVETRGADSLSQSILVGKLITLPAITCIANSLGARTVCQRALEYGLEENVKSIELEDREAVDTCKMFLDNKRILVEPACGVTLTICYEGRLKKVIPGLREGSSVVIVVCSGSNISFEILEKYGREFGV